MVVILSKRSLRSEGSGRAARCVAFFATQKSRVWLASFSNCTNYQSGALAPRHGHKQEGHGFRTWEKTSFGVAQRFQRCGMKPFLSIGGFSPEGHNP
jgi:hypothetical protein